MYETVLIATDGSEATDQAVDHGIALADRLGASVHALAVDEGAGSVQRDRLRTDVDEWLADALEAVEHAGERANVDVTTVTRSGAPAEEIVEYAESTDVDLIVVGTHARTGIDSVLAGSVAEAVVERAPVPVVTVRPDA